MDETSRLIDALRRHAEAQGICLDLRISFVPETLTGEVDSHAGWHVSLDGTHTAHDPVSLCGALRAVRWKLHGVAADARERAAKLSDSLEDKELGW